MSTTTTQAADTVTGTVADETIRGKKGDDVIDGGAGNDLLEGNQGDDTLAGGQGDDILFGGVGNDTLTGGEGADDFAMRITYGGNNTITDFSIGEDILSLYVDRKHFVLDNDLARNENHEAKLDQKLDDKIDKLDNRFFENGKDNDLFSGSGIQKADAFVEKALAQETDLSVQGDDLVITFFADEGTKGTTITLQGVAANEHVARVLDGPDDAGTQQSIILEMLMTGEIIATSGNDEITGSDGDDVIRALGGDDSFKGYGDKSLGNDTLDGGEGFDTANYWYQTGHIHASVDVNGNIQVEQILNSRSHSAGDSADYTDTLISVEKIVGTRGEDQYDFSQLGDMGGGKGITITDNSEQASNDFAIGSDFDDNINLLHGDDIIYGGKGNDTLKVTLGNNKIYGEDGDDHINGGNHSDYLDGGAGNDYIVGGHYYGDGSEELDDTLIGGAGEDTLRAGGGNDLIKTDGRGSVEDDYVDGGSGYDTLEYNDHIVNGLGTDAALNIYVTSANSFNVEAVDNSDGVAEANRVLSTDTVKNVEEIKGTRGDDVGNFAGLGYGITYKDKWTDAGDEVMTGSSHNDYFDVMWGNDIVHGGEGNDTIKTAGGSNELYGEGGDDHLQGGNHDDLLVGGDGNDTINGGRYHGADTIYGGDGSDTISAGGGDDYICADEYAPGHLRSSMYDDYVDGGDGIDTLYYSDNIEGGTHLEISVVNGSTFEVKAMNNSAVIATDKVKNVEVIHGTRGDDVVDFSGLGHGITYNDKWTDAGEEVITGTDHDDSFNVMHGDDTINGSGGNDYVDGGGGVDTLVYEAGSITEIAVHGPAYKQEYITRKDTNGDGTADAYDIVKNIEKIKIGDEEYEFNVQTFDYGDIVV